MFFAKKAKGKGKRFTTYGNLAREFYRDAGVHLPFVATFHNLWRMKILHGLKYGTKEFSMKDHRRVEKILAEAGRCSHAESMYEAGPQAVTQVRTPRIVILPALIINLMVGVNTFEYGPIEI